MSAESGEQALTAPGAPVFVVRARPFDGVLAVVCATVEPDGRVLVRDPLTNEYTARHALSERDQDRVLAAARAYVPPAPARFRFSGRIRVEIPDDEATAREVEEEARRAREEQEARDLEDVEAFARGDDPGG